MVAPNASRDRMRAPSHSFINKACAVFMSVALSALLVPTGSAFADSAAPEYGTVAGASSIMFAPDATAHFKAPSKNTDRLGYVSENAIGVEEVIGSIMAENTAYVAPVAANPEAAADGAAVAPDAGMAVQSDEGMTLGGELSFGEPTVVVTPVTTYEEFMAALADEDTNILVMDEITFTSVLTLDYDVVIDMAEGALIFDGPNAHIEIVDDAYVTFVEGGITGDGLAVVGAATLAEVPAKATAANENQAADETAGMALEAQAENANEPVAAEPVDEALIDVIDASVVLNGTTVTVGKNAAVGLRGTENSTIRMIEGTTATYDGSGVLVVTDGSLVINSSSLVANDDATTLSVGPDAVVSVDAYSEITSVGGTAVAITGDKASDSVSFNCVGKITGVTPLDISDKVKISNGTFPFKIDASHLSDDVTFLIVLDNNFLYTSAVKDVVMATAPVGSKIYPVIRGMVNWSDETVIKPPATEAPTTPTQPNQQQNWNQLEVVTPKPTTTPANQNTAPAGTPLNSTAVTTTVTPINNTSAPSAATLNPNMAPIAQYLADDATPLAQGLMNSGAVFGSFDDPEGTDILSYGGSPLRGTKGAVGTYAYSEPSGGLPWLPFVIGGVVLLVGGALVIFLVYRHQQTAALVALLDEEQDDYYFADMETPEDLEVYDDMEEYGAYDPYDL